MNTMVFESSTLNIQYKKGIPTRKISCEIKYNEIMSTSNIKNLRNHVYFKDLRISLLSFTLFMFGYIFHYVNLHTYIHSSNVICITTMYMTLLYFEHII